MKPFQLLAQLLDGVMFVFIRMQAPLSDATYGRLDIEFLILVDGTELHCSAAWQFWLPFHHAAKSPQYFMNL